MRVLKPIWTTNPEPTSRLRGRIERILGWAKVNGYREGENPARGIDNLDQLLPARGRVRNIEPQPALPYAQVAEFLTELRTQQGTAARALELAILTAARRREGPGIRWAET